MDSIDELYQDVILDHFQNPRCRHCIENAKAEAHVYNPLCGDEVQVMLNSDGTMVEEISFLGNGCAISQASASMMSELVKGKSIVEIEELYTKVTDLIKGTNTPHSDKCNSSNLGEPDLGDVVALGGVKKFPARVKCAVLAWEALGKCLLELKQVQSNGQ